MNKKIFLSFIFGIILMGVISTPKTFATTKKIYGDVNCDGFVNSSDALLVQRYAAKLETLKDYQLEIADVNYDGYVNDRDAQLILKKSVGSVKLFPVELKCFGDVNLDGEIDVGDVTCLTRYVNGWNKLTEYQKQFADINGDGEIDILDVVCLRQYLIGQIVYFPVQVQYGDINGDSKLDVKDMNLLYNYSKGRTKLSAKQQKIADLNQDGIVSLRDYRLAKKLTGYKE